MQKKLIAVAVAGALGIPAVAFAQNATVSVSGRAYVEYGYTNTGSSPVNGANIINPDVLQTPGSNISFQGEEKLGGNLSAWFKCESSMDVRGTVTGDSICQRNSALGLKGSFGNVFAGNWDTPFKLSRITTGGNETGHFGTATLLTGHSTTGADSGAATPGLFAVRQNNLISYHTPNFGGFTAMAAYTALTSNTNVAQATANNKPRLYSIGAGYKNGPVNVTAAYEKHVDYYVAGAVTGDEAGWLIGASYTFGNNLTLGGMYTRQKAELGVAESHVSAWQLGIDWSISGPHGLRAAYTNAGDVKGNATVLARRPAFNAAGDTGAYMLQARYVYALSKRTEFTAGVNRLKNDSNAGYRINALGSSGAGGQIGAKHTSYAMALDHRF